MRVLYQQVSAFPMQQPNPNFLLLFVISHPAAAINSENVKIRKLLIIFNNSMALVRERTMPTERSPLVDEASAKVCG
jgi:hypothetical protein